MRQDTNRRGPLPKRTSTEQKILSMLEKRERSIDEIADALAIWTSKTAARSAVHVLHLRGIVEPIGKGRDRVWKLVQPSDAVEALERMLRDSTRNGLGSWAVLVDMARHQTRTLRRRDLAHDLALRGATSSDRGAAQALAEMAAAIIGAPSERVPVLTVRPEGTATLTWIVRVVETAEPARAA